MTAAGSTEERNMRRKHSEIGETEISDDPEYIEREIIIASRRSEEFMETLQHKFQINTMEKMQSMTKQTNKTILQSVGSQRQGTNTTIEKMKVENEDNHRRMDEQINTTEQMMTMLEDSDRRRSDTKANDMEGKTSQEDQNQRRTVVTGFHDDTTTQEEQDTLKEITTTTGMSMEQIQIKCPTKPITHAFLQFKDNDENLIRSGNILKKELRGRKIKISHAIDAEERFQQQRLGYIKCYVRTKHDVPLVQIKMNRSGRHISVDGQIVIKTCANGSLKYHKYQDIETEVETTMEKWMTKKSSQRL